VGAAGLEMIRDSREGSTGRPTRSPAAWLPAQQRGWVARGVRACAGAARSMSRSAAVEINEVASSYRTWTASFRRRYSTPTRSRPRGRRGRITGNRGRLDAVSRRRWHRRPGVGNSG
jgi:hypothetical protein